MPDVWYWLVVVLRYTRLVSPPPVVVTTATRGPLGSGWVGDRQDIVFE